MYPPNNGWYFGLRLNDRYDTYNAQRNISVDCVNPITQLKNQLQGNF